MCAVTLGAYASFFEVQVPMSERQQTYGERVSFSTGHFQTTIQPIDDNGHAYTPGQTPSGPRRVGPIGGGETGGNGGLPSDPMWGDVAPIGPTPYILFILLLAAYVVIKRRRT